MKGRHGRIGVVLLPLAALAIAACVRDDGETDPADDPALSPEEAEAFRYTSENVGPATYWAALSNLANPIMFAGLGVEARITMGQRDEFLRRAGFVRRPPMGEMAIVGPVYAAGSPEFVRRPDYGDPATLRWNPDGFDRTLDPGAQAWTLLKITAPEFHIQYHDLRINKLVGLMMIPQAEDQARLLEDRLLTPDGAFAPRAPEGAFGEPVPRDQVAVLWGVSSLSSAAASDRRDYWHDAYRDMVDAERYRPLARRAFAAVRALPPSDPAGRALGVEALGRYALVTDGADREEALRMARDWARSLAEDPGSGLEDVALAVYGLIEAARLFDEPGLADRAAAAFRERLLPLWEEGAEVFRNEPGAERIVYTPFTVGAVVVALNALRWYGPDEVGREAEAMYPRFFENAVVRSGLLRASPLPLVNPEYLAKEPATSFAHPILPHPAEVGVAPVFAGEVVRSNGEWRVTDPTFRTADALFLSNMLAIRSDDRADPFLPGDRLRTLARR